GARALGLNARCVAGAWGSTRGGRGSLKFKNEKSDRVRAYTASMPVATFQGNRRSTASEERSVSAIRRYRSTSVTAPFVGPVLSAHVAGCGAGDGANAGTAVPVHLSGFGPDPLKRNGATGHGKGGRPTKKPGPPGTI